MKKIFVLTFALLLGAWLRAQELVIHHNEKGPFLVHTVAPKENFYSLGRLYNTPPKDIAAYNGLEMERGLTIGQAVNIPLTAANFSQEGQKGQPVYYIVGEKEGLYRVSVKNNKVLMANLRKWNDLRSDGISTGQKLVVGYLTGNGPVPSSAPVTAVAAPKPEATEKKEPVKPTEEKPDVATTVAEPQRREEKPVQKPEPVVEKRTESAKVSNMTLNDGNGGYFKPAFDAQVRTQPLRKDETATAGIFKTASGWQDAKYYALIDGVEPGTIIRVVNPNNNKAVYAKVLDKMSGIRQNQGYGLRISNAAATALDVTETDKFFVRVNY